MKAVIYLRTSTKKQAEQNVGYKNQLDHCFAVAKNYGCERTLVFIDSAVSGISDIRERLDQHAIDALDPGDLFIIKNVSRLARNENLFSELERVINTRGARLISALELECNQDNSEGKAARFVAAVRAEFDRELCINKTNKNIKKKKKQSLRIGNVQYGFQLANNTFALEPNLFEQKIIEYVRFLRAEKFSLSEIAIQLQAMNYRNRKGGRFYKSQVAKMLIERDQQGNRINYNLKKKNQINRNKK